MEIDVNFLAVILAAVVSMAVGFLWYSPFILGKPWMKLMKFSEEGLKKAQKEMGPLYGVSFVGALVMAFVLSHVTGMSEIVFEYSRVIAAISSAFWMWLGFVAPVQLTDVIFGNKQWKLFLINTGYQLTSLLAMGVVIGVIE